jgi:UrcA family protein
MYPYKKNSQPAGKRAALFILATCMTTLTVGTTSAIFAEPAYASPQETVRSKTVRYGDLNLASPQGRAALDRRIRLAAKQVCEVIGLPAIVQRRQVRTCTEAAHSKAWASAQQRINDTRFASRSVK